MYTDVKFVYDEAGDEFSMKTVAAAIEFGTSKIVTLLAESGGLSSSRCRIIGAGTVPYGGRGCDESEKNVIWYDPEGLPEAIERSVRAAERESKRSIREIYVGVPGNSIMVFTAVAEVEIQSADGRITSDDINNVMDAAADQLELAEMEPVVLHRSPAWFTIDGGKRTMRPQNFRGKKLQAEISFFVGDARFMDEVRAILGDMGITVNAFLAPTLGTAMLLVPFDERDRTPVILIDSGYLSTELSVVEGDGVTFHAVLPIGGMDITAALADELEIGMREAEVIKGKYNFMPDQFEKDSDFEVTYKDNTSITISRKFIQATIESEYHRMVDIINDTLDYAKDHISPRSVVYLTGGGLRMHGCREYMGEHLKYTVKTPQAKAATKLSHPRFASALGLMDLVMDLISSSSGRWNSSTAEENGSTNGFTKMFRG